MSIHLESTRNLPFIWNLLVDTQIYWNILESSKPETNVTYRSGTHNGKDFQQGGHSPRTTCFIRCRQSQPDLNCVPVCGVHRPSRHTASEETSSLKLASMGLGEQSGQMASHWPPRIPQKTFPSTMFFQKHVKTIWLIWSLWDETPRTMCKHCSIQGPPEFLATWVASSSLPSRTQMNSRGAETCRNTCKPLCKRSSPTQNHTRVCIL